MGPRHGLKLFLKNVKQKVKYRFAANDINARRASLGRPAARKNQFNSPEACASSV